MANSDIDVFVPNSKPHAVVLIFGWFGSQLRHVNKYSQLYHARSCATVTGVANSRAIIKGDKQILDEFAIDAAMKALKILREVDQDLPVITHVFSNGGTIPLSRLETLIHKANRARAQGNMTPMDEDLILLGNAMQKGGQIFDSSPCFPDFVTGLRGIGSGVQNAVARFIAQSAFVLMILVQKPLIWLSGHPSFTDQLWHHVMHRPIVPRQAFVYSTKDRITNCDKLEDLIAYRQHTVGIENILVKKFTDSKQEMLRRVESGPPSLEATSDDEDDKMDWEAEHIIIGGASFRI
jgi:Eukaryotic protein of unknown function (DUF829)